MFQTYSDALISTPLLYEDQPYLWSAVEQNIFRPWFYVSFVSEEQGLDLRTMVMIGHESSLASFLQTRVAEYVMVATPGHVNGTGLWQLELLERLVEYRGEGSALTYSYTIQGGRIYVTGEQHLVSDNHPRKELLFCNKTLKAPD